MLERGGAKLFRGLRDLFLINAMVSIGFDNEGCCKIFSIYL